MDPVGGDDRSDSEEEEATTHAHTRDEREARGGSDGPNEDSEEEEEGGRGRTAREGHGDDDDGDDGEDDGDDSATETQRIGNSVQRFARRCIQSGEFAKALAALMSVVEISELASLPCRQALLCAAQIFSLGGLEDSALACLMEIWDDMPPPYTTQTGQLLLVVLYERLQQPRHARYWSKRALGEDPPSPATGFHAWSSLADTSYEQGDWILSAEAFSRAFAVVVERHAWPTGANAFRLAARFLSAVVGVAQPRADAQAYRQQIAFALAMALAASDALDAVPIALRVFDGDFLLLRRVYAASFLALYGFLFGGEDRFVGRISRAWRVFQARRARRQAVEERERERHAVGSPTTATKKNRTRVKKPTAGPTAGPTAFTASDAERLRVLRQKTKARIQSLRVSSPAKARPPPQPTVPTGSTSDSILAAPPLPSRRRRDPTSPLGSPTRRKLETVRRLREAAAPTAADESTQRPGYAASSWCPGDEPAARSLLSLYAFPPLAARREQFEAAAGRAQSAADLDAAQLEEIEAFARLAHYRSRVLVGQHHPLSDLELARVTPSWLRRLDELLAFIETHETGQRTRPRAAGTHFSQIHARVLTQLTTIHRCVALQHGTTAFTLALAAITTRIARWQFGSSVAHDVVRGLRAARRVGEREETQRNLELFHAACASASPPS